MLLWIDHVSWNSKVLLLKTALLETTPQQKQNVQIHGLPLPNQVEIHWVMASAPLGGSFSQAGSQTPPQTYRLRICIHSKIWERMLYRVFRSSLFFAFSQPEFPQLEYGNITKCIQRGKKKIEGRQFTGAQECGGLWGNFSKFYTMQFLTM